ncbi:hypothetical protein VPHK479_0023 [Vibrio phage K479]
MSQITWRNVSGPNFGDVAGLASGAARTFEQAFGALNEVAGTEADLSQKNFLTQQKQEQQDYTRGQDALVNERADARLDIAKSQDQRAADRFADDLLTSAQSRKFAKNRNDQSNTLFDQEQTEYKRGEVNRGQRIAAEEAVQDIVDAADTAEDYPRLARAYAEKNNLDPTEEATLLQNLRTRDQNLFGLTATQQRVVQEQQAGDQQATQILDRELGAQEQAVATELNVDPQLLQLGQSGNTDITAERNALDKRLDSGGSADLVKYFTEKVGRAPTVEEFNYVVGRSEEVDATPFFGGGTEFKGAFEKGFESVIDTYRNDIGKGDDAEQRKNVEEYLKFTDKTNTVRRNAAQSAEDRLLNLQRQQRENNKARYGGLQSNPVLAQTGNTPETNASLAQLGKLYQTLTNAQ